MSSTSQASTIDSPCVGICTLDDDGYCLGCRRDMDEIARWGSMSAAERRAVWDALAERPCPDDVN